jgi:hypothetical protein
MSGCSTNKQPQPLAELFTNGGGAQGHALRHSRREVVVEIVVGVGVAEVDEVVGVAGEVEEVRRVGALDVRAVVRTLWLEPRDESDGVGGAVSKLSKWCDRSRGVPGEVCAVC